MALWQFDFYIVSREKCAMADELESQDILSWKQDEIIELMKNSKANKFCQNPMHFFEELLES
jgi:hypothetical protein